MHDSWAFGLDVGRAAACTLCEIAQRYGAGRRDWAMMEMEYAGPAVAACAA